jgi:hypothetical protein
MKENTRIKKMNENGREQNTLKALQAIDGGEESYKSTITAN